MLQRAERPIRVLHLYKTAPPEDIGGVGVCIANITATTAPQGVQHRVLVTTRESSSRIERWACGTEVFFCPQNFSFASLPFSLEMLRQFRRLSEWADIVQFHHPFPVQDLLHLFQRKRRYRSIVTYHSDVVRQKITGAVYALLNRPFLQSVDRVVATSQNYIDSSPVLQRFLTKTQVIHLGLNPEGLEHVPSQRMTDLEAKLGRGFFLFLGALRYYKGLTFLVDAARQTGLPLVIAGKGELEGELRAQAAGASNIRFITDVDEVDKWALLSLASVFVFPSHLRSEAFGISLLEAQIAKLPLITCELGTGTSFVNSDRQTGLVIPPANSKALAQSMLDLADNPTQRKIFGEAGHQRFHELFTSRVMGEAYLKLYSDLAGKLLS
ncbi:glycosyltransferase [Nitrincola alkalilacustris]|uniref:glycosyltransferase n=1 Tax=Nitrincola alkalilacustris TaxID=1571224 RepID=UPI00124D9B07|nr:glycosyltransferase [Nitrincola alkalilacustris]